MVVKLGLEQFVGHLAAPDLEAVRLEQEPDRSSEAAQGQQMLSLPVLW